MINVGYVGCGFMAQKVHLPNLTAIPDCRVLALAELRQDLGRKVQARFGIERLYADHTSMLADPDLDAIAVSAAFGVQGQIARDALLAGKDVFMEKPMAISLEQADAILEAERASGRRLMVGYMKRYDAGNELVKATLDAWRSSGEQGPLTLARNHGFCGNWTAGLDTPMDTSEEPMPVAPVVGPAWLPAEYLSAYIGYLQQYTHNINLLRWLLDAGDEVTIKAVDLNADGYTGVVVFDMAGVRAVLETGRLSHYRWDEHTQVYFQDGWLHTWAPPLLLRQVPAEVEIYRAGGQQTTTRAIPQDAWSWAYRREMDHFVSSVASGEPFRSPAQDTRTDVRLFEEIYRAWLEQRGIL
ncbi:MAG: Gfo/Idh/MocA family protein [Anaerolineae bacterium]|jgi:predicted dehydrogenase|nr:Gfo/Idh/MocA family oxidoreductase [Chloroflexota bacterium]